MCALVATRYNPAIKGFYSSHALSPFLPLVFSITVDQSNPV
jgi:hypothetical protein